MLVRNYINFAHNIVLIPAVFLFFGKGPYWTWLLVPLGLLLIAIVSFVGGLLCALLCARFRDLPQIVGNLMQVAFFISPVMWRPEALQEQAWYVVGLNPFAAFLRVVSEPMLGRVPGALTYLSTVVAITVLAAVTWPLFVRFRARIVYWL
jgi:lipopolysaccharide transport system permease protein